MKIVLFLSVLILPFEISLELYKVTMAEIKIKKTVGETIYWRGDNQCVIINRLINWRKLSVTVVII